MLKFFLKSSGKFDPKILSPEKVKNILIVRQHNQLGDMLCSVPLFAAIRKKYPEAHITLVASPINYEILFSDINPYINKVITYRKAPLKKLIEFYKELKNHDYQIGIVPSTVSLSRTSHLINYFSGAKVRVGVKSIDGKLNDMEYLLNVKSDFEWDTKKLHQVDRNLDVGKQIGCVLSESEKSEVMIHLSNDEISFADEYVKNNFPDVNKIIIGFHPGAGKTQNRWDKENFIDLIKLLHHKYNCYLMMTSGTIDKEITHHIKSELNKSGIEIIILENTPIRKLSAVLKKLDLYITNDTGTLHVAAGVDANIISLFGPTHGYEWAPIGENKIYIQSPTNEINDITVENVFEKAENLIESISFISEKKNLISQDHD
ncbi:MAG TPA: glycosyltransferase family 9 protein [Ignavibacteria bacterium]|nr:glycosyltransferase family 9 protein [Ignavibacteria bacterium]